MKQLYIFLGPPGCGKGTQAEFLGKTYGINNLSAGEILRNEVAKKTKIGKLAAPLLAKGLLVPSEMIVGVMLKKLGASKKSVIFDGFPRKMDQCMELDEYLKKHPIQTTVVYFHLADEIVLERITGRESCVCGAIFHTKFNPPKKKGICDKCGKKLFQRDDAKPSIVKDRLKVYHELTEPVIAFYKKNKNYTFKKITSAGAIEKTRKQVLDAINL